MNSAFNKPGAAFCAIVALVAGMIAVGIAFRPHRPNDPLEQKRSESPLADPQYVEFAGTRVPQFRDDNGIKLGLMWCPPGQFVMGGSASKLGNIPPEPLVDVTITRGFWLG